MAFEHPDIAERYRQVLEPQLAALMHTGAAAAAAAAKPSLEQLEALKALGYAR